MLTETPLRSVKIVIPAEKPLWATLKGMLKQSKSSLTRKLNLEYQTLVDNKPQRASLHEKMEKIRYQSLFKAFLLKAPALLVIFEEASEAMLSFSAEEEAESEDADESKYQLCTT